MFLLGEELVMLLLEGVGDVLEEEQAEHDVLVLGGVHAAAEGVGHLPQLSLVADRGAVRGLRTRGALWRCPLLACHPILASLEERRLTGAMIAPDGRGRKP